MTVNFSNPGELDIRAATVMGVNVKSHDTPLGYFGTGLKYAIAVLLRNKQSIRIHIGADRYSFLVANETIRGKDFALVHMTKNGGGKTPLGFTADMGKNWTLANAYRELWSNCRDENGIVSEIALAPRPGITQIIVDGAEFAAVHAARDEFILDKSKPKLLSTSTCEVYSGESESAFYRGIAIYKLPKPSTHTYNIVSDLSLTEDRTAARGYEVTSIIRQAYFSLPSALRTTGIISEEYFEHNMDWGYTYPPPDFRKQVESLVPLHFKSMSRDLLHEIDRLEIQHRDAWVAQEIGEGYGDMLALAMNWMADAGYTITVPVNYKPNIGENIHGLYASGQIWLCDKSFSSQTHLQEILLEEHLHAHTGLSDESREFQNSIIAELIKKIEELREFKKELPSIDARLAVPQISADWDKELDDGVPF